MVEVSKVDYAGLNDISLLSADSRETILETVRTFVMLPQGRLFRPQSPVTRAEFAETFVRSGTVLQFVGNSRIYADVRDLYTRSVVESVQSNGGGQLIYDASNGGSFYPDKLTTRLVAAVAFVKAAKLESSAASASLPASVADFAQIPAEFRGFAAVAVQKGFLKLEGNNFSPSRPLTRLELAQAINKINHLPR